LRPVSPQATANYPLAKAKTRQLAFACLTVPDYLDAHTPGSDSKISDLAWSIRWASPGLYRILPRDLRILP
jgi:hypothetical protein